MERTARALSVRSNCSFLSSARLPKPIASNSPHFRSVRLRKRSSPSLSSNNVEPTDDADEMDDVSEGGVRVDGVVDAAPVSGWKFGGKSIRFLYWSEYRGGSLSVGGAIRSHSLDPANARSDALDTDPRGRWAHDAALFTRSGEYMRTLRRTLSIRTVRAPRRGWGRSSFPSIGSIDGYPWIHAFRRVGTPSAGPAALAFASCQRMNARIRCSVAVVVRR